MKFELRWPGDLMDLAVVDRQWERVSMYVLDQGTWEWERDGDVVVAWYRSKWELVQTLHVMVELMVRRLEQRLEKGMMMLEGCQDEALGARLLEQWDVLRARYRILLVDRARVKAVIQEVGGGEMA